MTDILADIDAAADDWDSWDGRSVDAARWMPEGAPESVHDVPPAMRVWFAGVDLSPFVESIRQFEDQARALQRRLEEGPAAVPLTRFAADLAAAAPAEARQPAYMPRPSTVPPMWAVVPTRERRRRAG